jgi:hypothetical protein
LGRVLIHPSTSDAEKRKALSAREEVVVLVESLAYRLRKDPDALGWLSAALRDAFDIGYSARNHNRTEQIRRELEKKKTTPAQRALSAGKEKRLAVYLRLAKPHLSAQKPAAKTWGAIARKIVNPVNDELNKMGLGPVDWDTIRRALWETHKGRLG